MVGLIKRLSINEWIFSRTKIFRKKSENWIRFSNYATKADLKNITGDDTSKFPEKIDLVDLKYNLHELDLDKLKNVPTNISNLKSKVDKLDVDKLVLFLLI